MATTTNFGWETPDDTDLVKDGALAIRTLGNSIDTSLVDLKGGTTGQVLSKTSNTDMDFTWVAQDDSNAIQNAIVDAKGDLISATAADTPARLAVGTDGQVLTADSTTATGLKWNTATSGGWTELASGSLSTSSSALNLTTISGSYRNLVLIVRDFYTASDDYIKLRVNNSSGTYVYSNVKMTAASTAAFEATTSNAAWLIEPAFDNTDKNNMIYIEFLDYANSTANKIGRFSSIVRSGSDTYNQINQGTWAWIDISAITEVNFLTNGANFSGGTYVLYGVK